MFARTLTPLRVLLVEDSPDDALLLERELRRGGYEPSIARVETQQEIQEALKSAEWQLVITDHNMPGFDSFQALQWVVASGHDVPVIILSGSIGEEVAVEAMKAGANDYILKNNLTRLVPAIQRELRESERRRAHRRAEELIRHMAYHDALTDLVNRNEFSDRLQHALQSARDRGLQHAVLYLDLDQFKVVNDTCGHSAGDELLRRIAVILQQHIRDSDTLARLGGDEFALLLETCPISRALKMAQTILESVQNFRFLWQGRVFKIGVSIGVVSITASSPNAAEIMRKADMACYAAKDRGRNCIHLYTDTDAELARRHREMEWVERIGHALDEDGFSLVYQTMATLKDKERDTRVHREFLLRLKDAGNSDIAPTAFLPAAERYNLMPSIDQWVIKNAFAFLARQRREGKSDNHSKTFINLSGASIGESGIFNYIRKQFDLTGVAPSSVCFEITETAAVADFKRAIAFIHDIRGLGCGFALDDFGSGMCSFSYLKFLPVDFIKIDGAFVGNIFKNPVDRAIVDAVTRIAHVAGVRTVAEWVEDEATLRAVESLGVDFAQGFGIAEPAPLLHAH